MQGSLQYPYANEKKKATERDVITVDKPALEDEPALGGWCLTHQELGPCLILIHFPFA